MPTSRPVVAAVAILGAALGGCGGGGGAPGDPPAAAPAGGSPAAAPGADLEAALLDENDVGEGYREQQRQTATVGDLTRQAQPALGRITVDPARCTPYFRRASNAFGDPALAAAPVSAVGFAGSTPADTVLQALIRVDPATVPGVVEQAAIPSGCEKIAVALGPGRSVRVEVRRVDVERLGDESAGTDVTVFNGAAGTRMRYIIVQKADVRLTVQAAGAAIPRVAEIARAAYDKAVDELSL